MVAMVEGLGWVEIGIATHCYSANILHLRASIQWFCELSTIVSWLCVFTEIGFEQFVRISTSKSRIMKPSISYRHIWISTSSIRSVMYWQLGFLWAATIVSSWRDVTKRAMVHWMRDSVVWEASIACSDVSVASWPICFVLNGVPSYRQTIEWPVKPVMAGLHR